MVVLRQDGHNQWHAKREQLKIAIARCRICRRRPRVLPCDVLPRKRYSLPLIGGLLSDYMDKVKNLGLRGAVCGLLGDAPSHTSLHGWSEGVGDYLTGSRKRKIQGATPASRLLEESRRRHPEVLAREKDAIAISPHRYRSEGRKVRLEALSRFLGVTKALGGMGYWVTLILAWIVGGSFDFLAAISHTPIEHRDHARARGSRGQPQKEEPRCKIRGRSPPGDSS